MATHTVDAGDDCVEYTEKHTGTRAKIKSDLLVRVLTQRTLDYGPATAHWRLGWVCSIPHSARCGFNQDEVNSILVNGVPFPTGPLAKGIGAASVLKL